MTKTIVNTINVTNQYRTHLAYTLIGCCMLMIAFYIFNVYRIISSTIALQNVQSQTAILESGVQNLDSKYLELLNQITPDTLVSHGFTPGKVSTYISRNPSIGSIASVVHEL
ncbi:MAG: hypothetical protein WCK03_00625 [Candidatus Taylorbacteria bacterium]